MWYAGNPRSLAGQVEGLEPGVEARNSAISASIRTLVRALTNWGPATWETISINNAPEGAEMETTMSLFRTTIAATAIVAGMLASNAASAYERWINVHNAAGVDLVEVRISDIDNNSWGPDLVSGYIPSGYVDTLDPVNTRGYCRFDILLGYSDGSTAEIYDVNLCEATDLYTDGYYFEVRTI
jgi:hypothetical protein